MARGRMISKSWSTSKKRATLYRDAGPMAEFCLQLFPVLVAHSDDYGRLDGDPETVKLVCDPGSPRPVGDFTQALATLEHVGLVRRYDVAGTAWLQIVKFDEHQPGLLSKRSIAKSPAPPTDTELSGNSGLTQPNLTQPNLSKPKKNVSSEPPAASEPAVPWLAFPVIGPVGEWALSEALVAEWVASFPRLDVRGECLKALAWIRANGGRRKTAKGMARFLVSWLARAVDDGRGRRLELDVPPSRIVRECPDNPPCPVGTSPFRCHQRTQLEAAKKARSA